MDPALIAAVSSTIAALCGCVHTMFKFLSKSDCKSSCSSVDGVSVEIANPPNQDLD